jgi:hypothetical protein
MTKTDTLIEALARPNLDAAEQAFAELAAYQPAAPVPAGATALVAELLLGPAPTNLPPEVEVAWGQNADALYIDAGPVEAAIRSSRAALSAETLDNEGAAAERDRLLLENDALEALQGLLHELVRPWSPT